LGVSRQTLQLAIDRLRSEGLVESRRGFGWFVRERPVIVRLARNRLARSERAAGRGFFLTDAATQGWTPDVEATVSVERATSDVAHEL
jgi:GntR family transcriptional regulator